MNEKNTDNQHLDSNNDHQQSHDSKSSLFVDEVKQKPSVQLESKPNAQMGRAGVSFKKETNNRFTMQTYDKNS